MKSIFKTLALVAVGCLAAMQVNAQYVPSHDKYVTYITDSKGFVDYFPTWEPGTQLSEDENFFISRVRMKDRFVNRNSQARSYTDNDNQRKFALCTPMGISDTYWQTLPRYVFDGDNFSMWSYIDSQGGWSQSWIRNVGAYSDVCHKNGVANSGGVIFFDSWGGDNTGPQAIVNMLVTKNSDGTFKYLEKFIKFLRYYGVDGLSFNPEGTISNATTFQDFLAAVHESAPDYGWRFVTDWYGANGNSGGLDLGSTLNSGKSNWFVKNGKVVNDVYFLNYDWASTLSTSLSTAEGLLAGSSNNVYCGYDIQGNWMGRGRWTSIPNTKASVVFWGNHTTDMIYQNSTEKGSSDEAVQGCYQEKLEQVFSGGNRNPANTPTIVNGITESGSTAMAKFHGVAALMPARSTLQELPFVTRFSLGNGKVFRNEGEETFSNKWYGLSTQDYLPTWRWWITNDAGTVPSDEIGCKFTFDDSWWAGSCLKFSGSTACSNVRLFKTNFTVPASADVNLVYKLNGSKASNAKLFWSFVGSETTLHYYDIPAVETMGEWTNFTATAATLGMTGNVAVLGIKFANTNDSYEMLVGELGIVPQQTFSPVAPTITKAQLLQRTYKDLSYKLIWDCGKSAATLADNSIPTYNDDVDTWYFEVWSQMKGGQPVLDGCTTSWAHYVVGAKSSSSVSQYRIGVRAVAPDGKTKSDITWSSYMSVSATTVDGIEIDKPIIKANETFTVQYKDPGHANATQWQIINPLTSTTVATASSSKKITTSLATTGSYDVCVVDASGTHYYRGFVQISPDETGALPLINDFTAANTTLDPINTPSTNVSFDIQRWGEGTVSRGLEIQDPYMFRIPAEALPNSQSTYSIGFWLKPTKFSHSKYGTNLINQRDIQISWPNNNWGAFWVHIWPEATYNGSKCMNDGIISYTMYNNEASHSFQGNSNKHEIPNLSCCTDGFSSSNWSTPDDTKAYGLSLNTWTHVMIAYDGSKQYIFFNGKKVAENSATKNTYNDCPIYIGGSNVYHSGLFGVLDDIQVWTKALSESEVQTAMAGYDGKTKPSELRCYYTLESLTTTENSDGTKTYTFANEGSGASTLTGQYIEFIGAAGESTVGSTESSVYPNINVTGNPALPGTLPITTTAAMTAKGLGVTMGSGTKPTSATLTSDGDGVFDVTLTLSNMWGKASLTKERYITVGKGDAVTVSSVTALVKKYIEQPGTVTLENIQAAVDKVLGRGAVIVTPTIEYCDNCGTQLEDGVCQNTECPNCPNYVEPEPEVTTCPVADVAYALQAEGYGVYLDVETGVADGNKAYTNSVGFSSTPKAVYFEQSGTSWKIKNANGKYVSMPNSWNVVITDSSSATWTVSEVESGYVTITKSSNSSNYWSGDSANSTNIADGKPVYCDKTTALRFKWTLFKE